MPDPKTTQRKPSPQGAEPQPELAADVQPAAPSPLYRVVADFLGETHRKGDLVTANNLPAGSDVERLIRIGAIEPAIATAERDLYLPDEESPQPDPSTVFRVTIDALGRKHKRGDLITAADLVTKAVDRKTKTEIVVAPDMNRLMRVGALELVG